MSPKRTLFTTLIAATAAIAAPALAELRYENGTGGSAVFYGQFNPAYQSVDDGFSRKSTLVDNTNSNSRVGLWLRQEMDNGKFSFNFETALGLRPSAGVTQGFTPKGINWQRTNIRKVDFSYQTATFGTFYLGQGSVATDGVADVDLSGTALSTYNSIGDTAGGFRFRTAAGALTGPLIGAAMPNFDGGRRGRIRYDTPDFNGFTLSLAYGEEILAQNVDLKTRNVALRYNKEVGDFRMKGAVGYSKFDLGNGTDRHDTIGSFSVLHASGINVTVAAGDRKESGNYGYAKLGYIGNWLAAGSTALAIDYYDGSDLTSPGSKSRSIGIGATQKLDAYNTEIYLGLRNYELSEVGVAYADIESVLFGARWKF
jgi:porin-like protein